MLVLDVDGVDGSAFLGVDAGVGDTEAESADGSENVVEQAESVEDLQLKDGLIRREMVVEEDTLR